MANCLVTGGAGFIGSHIVDALIKEGHSVVVVDDLRTGKRENINPKAEFNFKDIRTLNLDDIDGMDYVFHEAASKYTVCQEDPREDWEVNAWGSYRLFNLCRMAKVKKIIHASTGSVLDGKPRSNYGISKYAAECYLRTFQVPHAILRYYHVFGPRQDDSDKGGVIPIFIRRMLNNEAITVFGTGAQARHFTPVEQVVKINLWAMENETPDVIHIVGKPEITILELAEKISDELKRDYRIKYAPLRPGEIMHFDLPVNGCEINFDEKLGETVQWYREYWLSHRTPMTVRSDVVLASPSL